MDSEMREIIMKYALQNAIFYGGKANDKAVIGKVMAAEPELRKKKQETIKEVEKIVREINGMSLEKQRKTLSYIAPEMMEKEGKKQEGLPELPYAKEGEVVTRFAPAPTGPLNISHLLRAVMLSYLYARKYKGKFILRFEDTDARKIRKEYYDMIKEDLKMAKVEWDEIVIESDDMDLYYKYAENLINEGLAYACTCSADDFKKHKLKKKDCPCRKQDIEKNMMLWKDMLSGKFREGEIVLRFKTSMQDPNPALRDPPVMRINEATHPLKGKKYRVWPLYNYANVIEDHKCGITHVFRGKEHEHNTEIQKRMYNAFGWEAPTTVNFGMIYLPGEKIHTRDIVKWIEEGKVSGWDDPKLHTVRALIRRGFQPEAMRAYAEHCSLTKTDIILDWKIFESYNRKIIDPIAKRYMVVIEPVKIELVGISEKKVNMKLHPEREEKRTLIVGKHVYVSKEDFIRFRGKKIRLKELATGVLEKRFVPEKEGKIGVQKIQWVPEPSIEVRIVYPEREKIGIGEYGLKNVSEDDIIQMERVGFGRIDKKTQHKIDVFFAHR